MLQRVRSIRLPFGSRPAPASALQPRGLLFVAVVLLAALPRAIDLASLEAGLLEEETLRLSQVYRILAGSGPAPLSLSPSGEPTTALYPLTALVALLGPSYLPARLASVLASLLTIALFYVLLRRLTEPLAALASALLLAYAPWYLALSRQALVGAWVLPCLIGAVLLARRALRVATVGSWLAAGACSGLALYGGLSGPLVPVAILAYLLASAGCERCQRPTLRAGLLPFLGAALLVSLPIWPAQFAGWTGAGGTVAGAYAAPAAAGERLVIAVRAFLLLDPVFGGDGRVLPAGMALLDPLTATFYALGLALALSGRRLGLLGACVLLPFALLAPLVWTVVPDLALTLPALVGMLILAGQTTDRLLAHPALRPLASIGLAAAVTATTLTNWLGYVEWQRAPTTVATRQPALAVEDFPLWRDQQLEAAQAGRAGPDLGLWLQSTASQRAERAGRPGDSTFRVATSLLATELSSYGPIDGLKRPRGVALDPAGTAFVLDSDGRMFRLDADGRLEASFSSPGGDGPPEEPSDLALEPDGNLLLLDAGRGRLTRLDQRGRLMASIGADWGMYRPRGLTVGLDGRIYVADTGHDRVIAASPDGRLEQTFDDLNQPTDVAVDPRGWLYVVQPDLGRLSVLDPRGSPRASWPVSRFNTVDGPHLAYLPAGALALTDPDKRQIVLLSPNGERLAQLGGDGGGEFRLPYAVAGGAERLLVADLGRAAVRGFALEGR